MTEEWKRILESKRALRCKLAASPIAEKLRMLDELRQRALTLRRAAIHLNAKSNILRETTGDYHEQKEKRKKP
jgi:hypothetical protein